MKIELGVWSLKATVQRRLPGIEMNEVEVHMATHSRRQVAHRQYKFDHNGGWGRMATYFRQQVAHRQYKFDHDGGWGRFR